MINAQQLVEEIRRELAPVEHEIKIRRHPYLAMLEAGRVRREELACLAGEKHHIIQSDLRVEASARRGISTASGRRARP